MSNNPEFPAPPAAIRRLPHRPRFTLSISARLSLHRYKHTLRKRQEAFYWWRKAWHTYYYGMTPVRRR
jgi:hypothetical protein